VLATGNDASCEDRCNNCCVDFGMVCQDNVRMKGENVMSSCGRFSVGMDNWVCTCGIVIDKGFELTIAWCGKDDQGEPFCVML